MMPISNGKNNLKQAYNAFESFIEHQEIDTMKNWGILNDDKDKIFWEFKAVAQSTDFNIDYYFRIYLKDSNWVVEEL